MLPSSPNSWPATAARSAAGTKSMPRSPVAPAPARFRRQAHHRLAAPDLDPGGTVQQLARQQLALPLRLAAAEAGVLLHRIAQLPGPGQLHDVAVESADDLGSVSIGAYLERVLALQLEEHRGLGENGAKNTEGAIAKLMATEAGNAAADAAIQAHGGYGYTREYVVEKIKQTETTNRAGHSDVPVEPIVIEKAEISE